MSDYSELKRLASLAKNWSGEIGEDDWYTACCFDKPKFSVLDAEFIAKCEPGSVLALIAENERYLKLVERMVDQYVPLTELEGVPGHSRVVELVEVVAERDQLKTEVEGLLAQHGRDSAELRSLCQARDYARKDRDQLKAEVARSTEREIMQLAEIEALRKAVEFGADCFRKISSGDGYGHADLAESILRRAGIAMGKGEQP